MNNGQIPTEEAAREETDFKDLVHLTNELVDLCRSAQRAHLENAVGPTENSE